MDGKEALHVQYHALRDLVPEEDWRVDTEVIHELGQDFRYTIDTHPGQVTKDILLWCYGCNKGKNPRESVAEIVCRLLSHQDHEKQ